MTPPLRARRDLTEAQKAALKALPVYLTREGFLSHNAPHGGLLRALRRRGLAVVDGEAWRRTPEGDAELAWIEAAR